MIRISNYSYADVVELLARLPKDLDTVVDLGAGKRDSPVSLQVAQIPCKHLISVEAFDPYISYLLLSNPIADTHDVVKAHITHSNYKVKECDLVLMIDVIEHLENEEALKLIEHLQSVAKRIVIFTVVGDTVGYSNHDMDNSLQEHKSAWYPENFEDLGFEVTVYEDFHHHLGDGHVDAMWAVWKRGD